MRNLISNFKAPMKPTNLLLSFFVLFILNAHSGWEEQMKELVGSNPGSLVLLCSIKKEYDAKGCSDGCFEKVLSTLKKNQIHGHKIWILFKEVCKENKDKFFTIINAINLGFVTLNQVSFAIDNHGEGIDFSAVEQTVLPVLPHIHNTSFPETPYPITYFLTGAHM